MRFTVALISSLLLPTAEAFAPLPSASNRWSSPTSPLSMAMDAPPAAATSSVPEIVKAPGGAPSAVRYSDFLKLVKADRVEKVTFSADGTKLLGVDNDGTRIAIEALPNDPDLLTELTGHKVRCKFSRQGERERCGWRQIRTIRAEVENAIWSPPPLHVRRGGACMRSLLN